MAVRVRVPVLLRNLTGGQAEVAVEGSTVAEVLAALESRYPGVRARLYDEQGALRRYVNIYVNDKDIRTLGGEATPVKDGDELAIVPAIAGGR
ncbi:MAG: ubiquitin-like small modifier protein 1 [Bacillota bacterium]|nr:molybdopterin synthase sulfur carrier subunit [Bacillota bacterium]REJ36991.1 MAG: molybdopterin synthase sulfur carrier subunit [Bacillota bacterium]